MIITLTGPSAVGKTSVMKRLLKEVPGARLLRSVTTRAPRPSDAEAEYLYLSNEEFEQRKGEGAFAWTTPPFAGKSYGTLASDVRVALASDDPYFAAIVPSTVPALHEFASVEGFATRVRSIYIVAPDRETLLHRLTVDRGESMESALGKIEACVGWDQLARDTRVHGTFPYLLVHDRNDLSEKFWHVLHHVHRSWPE